MEIPGQTRKPRDVAVNGKITIPEVIDGFADYYRQPGNSAWGSLHCVLEDGNVRDRDVQGCIDYAVEKGDVEGEQLARILLTLTKSQRLRLGRTADWRTRMPTPKDVDAVLADIADRLVYFEENPILGDNMAALPPRPTPMSHEERVAFYAKLFGQ